MCQNHLILKCEHFLQIHIYFCFYFENPLIIHFSLPFNAKKDNNLTLHIFCIVLKYSTVIDGSDYSKKTSWNKDKKKHAKTKLLFHTAGNTPLI